MKNAPELMLVPGRSGPEAWRVRGTEPPTQEANLKTSPGWVAVPTHHTLSVPVRLLTSDPAQQEAAVQLELEAAGLPSEDLTPHRFAIQAADPSGRDGSAAVFVIDGTAPAGADSSRTLDSAYAPSACFHPLTAGVLTLWRELGHWVVAIPHESGRLLHAQALCARELDADAAGEIRCILAALELADLLPRLERIEIECGEEEPPPAASFARGLDLPVLTTVPRQPRVPELPSRVVPDAIVQGRADRSRQRLILSSLGAVLLVVVAALGAFGARLYVREQAVVAEQARIDAQFPELQAVRDAQTAFNTLDPALNRDQFIVEMFYQLVNLLPPKGIRITRFQVTAESLIIDGVASSTQHAIDFNGDLSGAEFFKDWGFEQGFTQNPSLQDGSATFRAEGRLQTAASTGDEVAAVQ